jgi:hypothetical protein
MATATRGAEGAAIDPVTVEVIRGAMETVAYEMATHVSLSATTPILNQSNERNATILDGRGALAALSVGIPQFMLSSTLPVRFALEFFEAEGLNDGDVLVANDPYHGGGHLPDYNVFAPVVVDGELVLIASIQCHHADTGGGMPGGYNAEAVDIWAEGVRFPAVKLYDRGVERRDVTYMMKVNNRTPTFIGDLRAQVGAAQLGVRRLKEIVARHGRANVAAAVDHSIDYAAKRFREEVSSWPDGVYEADCYVDHDPIGNRDIHVHVAVSVAGDQLTVDFTGSDTREGLKAYSTFGNTRGYVIAQLASMMDPAIPKNEGFFDSIDLIVPEGCVLNPRPGQTVAAGTHHPGVEVGEAIAKAMSAVLPERSCPQIYKLGGPSVFVGQHPETGGGPGRLGLDARLLRQPDPGDRRDQRVDLPGAPRVVRLPHRQRRRRTLAGLPGLAGGEAHAGAGRPLDLDGGHEVPDGGRRGRLRRRPQRAHGALRHAARTHREHRERRAPRSRRGLRVPLRRRRGLRGSLRAGSAGGARRRARRAGLAGVGATRLRGGLHRQRRGLEPGGGRGRDPAPAHAVALLMVGDVPRREHSR